MFPMMFSIRAMTMGQMSDSMKNSIFGISLEKYMLCISR